MSLLVSMSLTYIPLRHEFETIPGLETIPQVCSIWASGPYSLCARFRDFCS